MLYKVVMLVCLVSVACTSSPNKKIQTDPEEIYPEEKTSEPLLKGELHIIEIKQIKFQPDEIRIRKGDEVRWVNHDITDHDVTEQSSKAWASSRLSTGQSWSIVVTQSTD
jgi:plastocyanin